MRSLVRDLVTRPAALAAVAVLAVCVPVTERSAVGATPADLACLVLIGGAGVRALRGGWPSPARSRLWYALAAVVLGLVASTVAAQSPVASLPGLIRYLEIFVVVPVAVVLAVRDRRDVALVCGAVLAVGVVEGAVGLWQSATGTGAPFDGRDVRPMGTFGALGVMGLATVLGYAVVVAVGLALRARGRPRAALLGLAAALTVPLLLSLARGALIATAAALAAMLVVSLRPRALAGLLVAAAAAALLLATGPAEQSLAADSGPVGRFTTVASAASLPQRSVPDGQDRSQSALASWRDHPVTGVGLTGFAEFRDVPNMYLLVLSEQGLVGIVAFVALLAALVIRSVRRTWATRTVPAGGIGPAAVGVLTWTAVNFAYAGIGGPTAVLTAVLLGLAAGWALPDPAPTARAGLKAAPA